jgi:hypothetical protein
MQSWLRSLALAAAVAGAAATVACGGGGQKPGADGGGSGGNGGNGGNGGMAGPDGGGTGGLTLVGWVDDLVSAHTDETSASDTVEDKVGVITDTSDPAAFDPLLQSHAQ